MKLTGERCGSVVPGRSIRSLLLRRLDEAAYLTGDKETRVALVPHDPPLTGPSRPAATSSRVTTSPYDVPQVVVHRVTLPDTGR